MDDIMGADGIGDTIVLILSSLRRLSGNFTTANRISRYFESDGFQCILRDPSAFTTEVEFRTFISEHQVDVVIGLHALHTSAYLKSCGVPFIVMFGGTDINEYSKYPQHYNTMTHLVKKAQYLVAFSQQMVNSVLTLWIDEDLGVRFKEYIKHLPGVVYMGALDQADTHAATRDSTALLNSSLSEGNSMALLEAMSLGTLAIVRDIPGNHDLVEDQVSGLTYSTPQDFIAKAELVIHNPGLRQRLAERGRQMVRDRHNQNNEAYTYRKIVMAASRRAPPEVNPGSEVSQGSDVSSGRPGASTS